MSRSSTAITSKNPPQFPTKSAWARGPPQQVATATSRSQSPAPTTPITPTTPSTSSNFHGSHSRRPSTLGQGVAIKEGVSVPRNNVGAAKQGSAAVTFGSIDDATAPISSSPASAPIAKPAEGVKSFGSVAVQNGATTAATKSALMNRSSSLASTPSMTTSATATPSSTSSSAPKFDVSKLFQGPSVTAPSAPDASSAVRPSNLPPPPHQPGQGHYGPPSFIRPQGPNGNTNGGPPRSPSYTRSMANGTSGGVGVSGRPPSGPGAGPGAIPAAIPSPRLASHAPAPGAPPAGMPPAGVWPGYYSYYPPPDQYMSYSPGWVPQQLPHSQPQPPHHPPQGPPGPPPVGMPMSPRNPPPPLQQPGTPTSNHSAPSPAHTQPHGPPSHVPPPTVTSPPPTPSTTSGPAGARLNTNASTFVPGKRISIKSVDGKEVDLGSLKRSGQSPVQGPSHAPSPIVVKQESKRQSVRIESPEQKEKRMAEERKEKEKEQAAKKAKEEKEREEKEKERKEAEELKEKERKEAEERIEKERLRKEAEERHKREEEEKAKKEVEERKRQKEKEEEEKRLAEEREKERLEAEQLKEEEEKKRAAEAKVAEEARAKAAAEASGKEEGEIDEPAETKPSTTEDQQTKPTEKEGLRIDTAVPSPEARRRPGPLDLRNVGSNIPPSLPSALATARIIEDLGHVPYPEGIKSPKVELNVNAAKGKFRYDRDFLLQFMSICKEKPDNLPPLDAIGLEPSDQTFSMSRGGSGRRSSSMATPTSRQASIGLGFMGSSMGKSSGSSFAGMGNFTTASKLSSEERFAMASNARSSLASGSVSGMSTSGRPPSMARTASQGGSSKDRQRTRSTRGTTRDNSNRASVAGHPSQTPSNMAPAFEPVAPLEQSANRWVPTSSKRSQAIDSDSPEIVDRKVKALLNKLTMERFDSISDQIIEWANKSEREKDGRTLIQVIRLVFEKATDEATFSEMYARLCRKMMEQISPKVQDDGILNSEGKPFAGGQLFRKYLLNRCQEDFERGWVAKETAAAAAAVKAHEDQAVKDANESAGKKEILGEAELYSDEYYAAAKAKRRGLGLIRFIGELFKLQMLTERIMHECIKKLLSNVENPEEEEIESLCKLLTTVGAMIDTPKARAHMDVYFSRMKELTKSKNVNSRMTFMLQDVVELRDMKWIPRNLVAAPATIAQIHEAAAKEKAAHEKESFNRQATMSRGGSRRGADRGDGTLVGPDGWSVAGSGPPRPPPKAGDLSNFGKISKPAPMTFGPSGIFAGKKESKGREASVSRTASSSNMFSMLSNADAAAEATATKSSRPPSRKPSVDLTQSVGASDQPQQRRKINLLPRSKPVEEIKASDVVEDADSEDGSVAAGPSMTEEEVKRKIDEDVKEFFSIRSLDEAESYFSSLPQEYRFRLVDKLAMQGIDGKAPDIPLVANLFMRAREKDLCSPAAFEEGLTQLAELVEDLAIDVPKAFDFFAQWIKAAGLDKDEEARTRLASKLPENGDKLLALLA